jgi:peptidoglycan/LPS O-acetylase OafA/YrhL
MSLMPISMSWTSLFRAAFWLAALGAFVLAVIPGSVGPPEQYDKLNHAFAFMVLGALGVLGFPTRRPVTLFVGLALFGAAIEITQGLPFVHRDCSLWDWLTDCAASVAALGLMAVGRRFGLIKRAVP